jgi:2-iminobutanoate/2-iminopropanoate deaminase
MPKRISIEVAGATHHNPIPSASRIGPFIASGGIFGINPETQRYGDTIEEQCALMFQNLRRVLEAAGAAPEHVLKLTVWMKDISQRPVLNKSWLEMFPDAHSRPARHAMASPELAAPALIQCEFLAVVMD